MEYELCGKYKDGFSLIDIAKKIGTCGMPEFIELMESRTNTIEKFKWDHWGSNFIIATNVTWFINKGFIQEKQELRCCPICNRDVRIFEHGEFAGRSSALIGCPVTEGGCGLNFSINWDRQERIDLWNREG